MINIISRALAQRHTTGPKKVVQNLLHGLDLINYPYVINRHPSATQRLWVHDDSAALEEAARIPTVFTVAGPNIAALPRAMPALAHYERMVWLVPSPWVERWWKSAGPVPAPLAVWPVGVNTTEYAPVSGSRDTVILYVKQRSEGEVRHVVALLSARGIAYVQVTYGAYREQEYRTLLGRARYVIWVGRHETQGLALEETLSAGVPILVWDVTHIGHWSAPARYTGVYTDAELAWSDITAAPYFNEQCGVRIHSGVELEAAIAAMEQRWSDFNPRSYIESRLSLAGQAQAFVGLYEQHFGLPAGGDMTGPAVTMRPWKHATKRYMAYERVKNTMKTIIKTLLGERY